MKRKFSLLLLAFGWTLTVSAQVVLTEDFNSNFQLNATTGWTVINNSQPVGTHSWFPGNSGVFSAYNGSVSEYYAANFNSTSGTGDISNWLISPSLNLINGAVIQFATRTSTGITTYPDRLELRLSATNANTLPLGSTAVGSFTNLVFSVNPQLSASLPSAQTATSVNGYPQSWTVYTATVSGVTGTVSGRLAFRYWVTSGGPGGNNSNYIGLDAFKYTLPCLPQATLSAASGNTAGVCSGNTVALSASSSGSPGAMTYTWSNGATGSAVVVSPGASTTYTVLGETSGGCISSATVAVTVTQTPLLFSPSYTVCSSPVPTLTLNATGAGSYTWNATPASSIVVSPTATTVYTVTGAASGNSLCMAVTEVTITVGSSLSIDLVSSTPSLCSGASATLMAYSGASTYSWSSGSATTSSISVSPTVTTTYTVAGLYGTLPLICAGINTIAISVYNLPVISSSVSPSSTLCSGKSFTATASGASMYMFSLGAATSSTNPFELTTPNVAAPTVLQYSVVGTSTDGCSATGVYSITVNPNPTLSINPFAPTPCVYGSVSIIASGASSYAWSGPITANTSSVNYTAGSTPTTVVAVLNGTSSLGCTSTSSVSIVVSQCIGLDEKAESNNVKVYPNPFNGVITIDGYISHFEIYNAIGQLVLNGSLENGGNINASALENGVYLIKTYSANNGLVKTTRLIKN